MKKLIACLSLVLVVALGVVGLTACKKKNNQPKVDPEAEIIGAWVTSFGGNFDKDGNRLQTLHSDGAYEGELYKFEADHIVYWMNEKEEWQVLGNWTYENDVITMFEEGKFEQKLTRENDKFVLKIDYEEGNYALLYFSKA